jgi:hypothetical protein
MHLWSTPKLADEIVAGEVSASEKVAYFVFAEVFYVAIAYAAWYVSSFHASWLYIYEAVVVGVVTLAGAHKVVSSYQRPIDGAFFEMAYLLSVPLMVKTTLAMWVAIWGGSWLMSALLEHLFPESVESAWALSYWVGRLWQVFPFLVAVAIAVVFWYRLAHHVAYVVAKRGA